MLPYILSGLGFEVVVEDLRAARKSRSIMPAERLKLQIGHTVSLRLIRLLPLFCTDPQPPVSPCLAPVGSVRPL
jgi:hypothetical protein